MRDLQIGGDLSRYLQRQRTQDIAVEVLFVDAIFQFAKFVDMEFIQQVEISTVVCQFKCIELELEATITYTARRAGLERKFWKRNRISSTWGS